MKLSDFVQMDAVVPELSARDRNGVVRELIQSLADHGAIPPDLVDALVKHTIQREKPGQHRFRKRGGGPARQARTRSEADRHDWPLEPWSGLRGPGPLPVYMVFLLLSPKSDPDAHLAAMEKIFRHLQRDNFRRFLRQADTQEAIRDLLVEADELP